MLTRSRTAPVHRAVGILQIAATSSCAQTRNCAFFFGKPIQSMYGICAYMWLIFMVNVGTYTSPMDAIGRDRMFLNKIHEISMQFSVQTQHFNQFNRLSPHKNGTNQHRSHHTQEPHPTPIMG